MRFVKAPKIELFRNRDSDITEPCSYWIRDYGKFILEQL